MIEMTLVPQTDNRPAVFLGMLSQTGVRIYRYRMSNLAQQRQIVVRVAVKPAIRSIVARFGQPSIQAFNFALLEAGNAR